MEERMELEAWNRANRKWVKGYSTVSEDYRYWLNLNLFMYHVSINLWYRKAR